MQLRSHRRFDKQFEKLSPKLQHKVKIVTQQFRENPHNHHLHNHALRGHMQGKRALSVTGDIRIIFHEEGNYAFVTFLAVGTHNQVY